MTITEYTYKKLSADEGKMLYDGEKYAKDAYISEGEDPSKWQEVDEPQPEPTNEPIDESEQENE